MNSGRWLRFCDKIRNSNPEYRHSRIISLARQFAGQAGDHPDYIHYWALQMLMPDDQQVEAESPGKQLTRNFKADMIKVASEVLSESSVRT